MPQKKYIALSSIFIYLLTLNYSFQASFQLHKEREANIAKSLLLKMRDLSVVEADLQSAAIVDDHERSLSQGREEANSNHTDGISVERIF